MDPASIPEVRRSAEEMFASGLFCAESVILAIAKARGVESEILPRIATAFCSGMARSCGTCGALTGAIMGVGLALGRSEPCESVELSYRATQRLIQEFEREFGSRDCHVLLDDCDLNTPEGQARFKAQRLGKRCFAFTGKAAEIAARVICESDSEPCSATRSRTAGPLALPSIVVDKIVDRPLRVDLARWLGVPPTRRSGGLELHVNAPADRRGDVDERIH